MTHLTRTCPRPPTAELSLRLQLLGDDDAALLRVISALSRRRCKVLGAHLAYDADSRGHLELLVRAPAPHAGRVAHWLGALVDVAAVRTL